VSTVGFSLWLGDKAFHSTIVLGKNENLKAYVWLGKVKKQEPSAVERVEQDVEQDDQAISVTACCRLYRMNKGAMTFFC